MKRIYFDMDGVLVHYDEGAAITKPFNIPNSRYFTTCPGNDLACALFRRAYAMCGVDTMVLTRVYLELTGQELEEQLNETIRDKRIWCRQQFNLPDSRFLHLRQTLDKRSVILAIPEQERPNCLLIDDDPAILDKWVGYGGAGIQYLQADRNVSRWNDGPVIAEADGITETQAFAMLTQFIKKEAMSA